jgi:hypothetical protein
MSIGFSTEMSAWLVNALQPEPIMLILGGRQTVAGG